MMLDGTEELQYSTPSSLEEARMYLKSAKEQFARSPTYHNARAIQICQRQYDSKVKEERDVWHVLDGGKGIVPISQEQAMTSALQEIMYRGLELEELYKGVPMAPTTYVRYFTSVATACLKQFGKLSPPNEITTIEGYPIG